jgi:hypothetical protein
MENFVKFFDHLEYFTPFVYNLCSFRIVCGNWVYFLRFGLFGPRKIWQPWVKVHLHKTWFLCRVVSHNAMRHSWDGS